MSTGDNIERFAFMYGFMWLSGQFGKKVMKGKNKPRSEAGFGLESRSGRLRQFKGRDF
ncbi:hypothetical protein GCM10007906_43080 [Vibrio hyugaensis]|uniref:Uncharacterized protein n=1 Tax=Vibrio hyugaensis TaxID=1534743 RepID=A0ABQ5YCC6_9VIBR|nr:hypothetical protein GCM10007906_43080 [Vibrio hyugaensis]